MMMLPSFFRCSTLWSKLRSLRISKNKLSVNELPEENKLSIKDLPEDVLLDIFVRLPINAIGQCMCVSKQWCSLLKRPSFISFYNNESKRIRYFVLWKDDHQLQFYVDNRSLDEYKLYTIPIDKVYNFPNQSCIAICNGVICLARDPFTLVLWNPTIQKLLNLPSPNAMPNRPAVNNHHLGFAFDSLAKDYKVFRILEYGQGIDSHIEIFSLIHNSWKFGCHIDHKYLVGDQAPLLFNGTLHWIAYEGCLNKIDSSVILGFDMKLELFHQFKFPSKMEARSLFKNKLNLITYRDSSLAAVLEDGLLVNNKIELWVMKEYGDMVSWTNLWKFEGVNWRGIHWMTGFRSIVSKYESYDVSIEDLLPSLTRFNRNMITEITTEEDVETTIVKRILTNHVLRPFEESLFLLDNANAENTKLWSQSGDE